MFHCVLGWIWRDSLFLALNDIISTLRNNRRVLGKLYTDTMIVYYIFLDAAILHRNLLFLFFVKPNKICFLCIWRGEDWKPLLSKYFGNQMWLRLLSHMYDSLQYLTFVDFSK